MAPLPDTIDTVEQLDELLSRPDPAMVEMLGRLDGDIMIVGCGGKMGPTLTRLALRAVDQASTGATVYGVARRPCDDLARAGAEILTCDMLDLDSVAALPPVKNVLYLIGRKFGSTGSEELTWAVNTIAASHAGRTFAAWGARVVAFSTGCVYPIVDVASGGATEQTPPAPIGEYAMSCLGRERMFDYHSSDAGLAVLHYRLNYAQELRYGVLVDVARAVLADEPVDITTDYANVIWQGDACNQALRCLAHASSPPAILNITGPEMVSIPQAAERFGELLGRDVTFTGEATGRGYLSNAARAAERFGPPSVSPEQLIEWIAHWLTIGGQGLDKPTHFQTQDGRF